MQELLSREAQQFFDGIGKERFTSRFRDDNRIRLAGNVTMRGCGLGIGARLRLRKTLVRTFPGARVGWDRLARKGALYTQLSLTTGLVVDLVTVHLQAGYDERASAVRALQLTDLKALIGAVGSPQRPFIVCGDFNIDGREHLRDRVSYRGLSEALDGFNDLGAAADLPTFDPRPQGNALAFAHEPDASEQRVDYIFFRPANGTSRFHCSEVGRFFDQPLTHSIGAHGRGVWASDHYGLSATFTYEGDPAA
jgi:endonuclease/exonuclease/phosphatase family metal-dependent hydrolase